MPNLADFLSWAKERADNPNVGYSQNFREGQQVSYQEALNFGGNYHYDFENYAGTDAIITYYDCSSFVSIDCVKVGISGAYCTNTAYLADMLLNCGWTELDNGDYLIPGDIAMYRHGTVSNGSGHTLLVYEAGSQYTCTYVGANGRNGTDKYTIPKALPDQVSFSVGYNGFERFFRFNKWDDEEPVINPTNDPISTVLICAILGNWAQESTLNPNCWENGVPKNWYYIWDGYGGYGLKGWTNIFYNNTYVMNLEDLYNWMSSKNYAMDSGDGQVAYTYESDHVYNYSSAMTDADKILSHSWDEWCNDWQGATDDLYQMTYDYFRCVEGINDNSFDKRYRYAQYFYENLPEHINDDDITAWYLGDNYIIGDIDTGDMTHILNNAVMIFRRFQKLNGSEGTSNYPNSGNVSGNYGDDGVRTQEEQEEAASLQDFLMAMLGRAGNGTDNINIHINKPPKKGV